MRLYVTGEQTGGPWRDFDRWPPCDDTPRQLWIAGEDSLGWESPQPGSGGRRRYRYDPAAPTPALGGPIMVTSKPVRDNRSLEERPDVVTFTSEPLQGVLEAIGPVRVQLWARGSEPHFDLFARVCEVDFAGVSRNVTDALASVETDRFEQANDGSFRVEFELWPIAHRFAAGSRIRLQVSSGSSPRYVRNPGTGEPPLSAKELLAVDVELLWGADHPSSVLLPGITAS